MPADKTNTVTSDTNQPYTILRIKRKRNEEPLDALVVESLRRKKSRGVGVFQYAETVEDGVWDDVQKQKDIQEKISRLAQETVPKSGTKLTTDSTTDNVPSSSPVVRPSLRDENARRYTIIEHEDPKGRHKRIRTTPPEVLPAKSTETRRKSVIDFRMYDAVLASQRLMAKDQASTELDKFLPLLNDYLKIHDTNPSDDVRKESIKAVTDNRLHAVTSNDDYVWDVFYHRPTTVSEWNAVAANVGMLTGLPSDFEGYDSLSDSDEEFLDEADEDSNAEEYYKNDYPDEDDDSDESNEDSDYGRIVHYHNSDNDFD